MKKIFSILLNIIYPPKCIICQDILEFNTQKWICETCESLIFPIEKDTCIKCGVPVENENSICRECTSKNALFVKNHALFVYDDTIRRLIHNFKYANYRENINGIRYLLNKYLDLSIFNGIDFLSYVPLHKMKIKKRGFNQAYLLAKEISEITKIPILFEAITRSKNTTPQSHLGYQARVKNLEDAFTFNKKMNVHSKNILIIDDIYTTGSTIQECAKVFLNNGAANIYSFTFSIALKL